MSNVCPHHEGWSHKWFLGSRGESVGYGNNVPIIYRIKKESKISGEPTDDKTANKEPLQSYIE